MFHKRRFTGLVLTGLMIGAVIPPSGCGNSAGLFFVEDWVRDLILGPLISIPGDIAVALLTGGVEGPEGPQGDPGATGATGPQGDPGPAGADASTLFDVQIDDFFGWLSTSFTPASVPLTEPRLGQFATFPDTVAYRVLIPPTYNGTNPIIMRVALKRSGPASSGGPFDFEVFGKRLQNGSATVANYINPPTTTVTPTGPYTGTEFILLDLPINVAVPAGLGGGTVAAGDMLAFELLTTTGDGGSYEIMSVEFIETEGSPTVSGATIS